MNTMKKKTSVLSRVFCKRVLIRNVPKSERNEAVRSDQSVHVGWSQLLGLQS